MKRQRKRKLPTIPLPKDSPCGIQYESLYVIGLSDAKETHKFCCEPSVFMTEIIPLPPPEGMGRYFIYKIDVQGGIRKIFRWHVIKRDWIIFYDKT